MHCGHDCFGEDADVFRAECWLTDDTERVFAVERASPGFGSRKRMCLGRYIAELEIEKVILALLLIFKVSDSTRLSIKMCRSCTNTKVKLVLKDPSITPVCGQLHLFS